MNAKHFILGALVVAAPAIAQQEQQGQQPMQGQEMQEPQQPQMDPQAGQGGSEGQPQGQMMKTEKLPKEDVEFVKKLHKANREEIELGDVAQMQSRREEVKSFGKMIVDDHRKADEMLSKMATEHGITIDLNEEAMKMADKYRKKSGDEFDKEFLTKMVKDHDKVINMITEKGHKLVPELQTMTNEMLPVLRQHRTEAKRLLDMVKGEHAARSKPPAR